VRFHFLFILFFLARWQHSHGQSSKIDSLREHLETIQGTAHIDLLNAYAYAISSYDYLAAQKTIQDAYQQSHQLNYKKGLAESMLYKGITESNIGQDSLSRISFRKCLLYADQAKENQVKGRALTSLGLGFLNFDQLDSSWICYRQAYEALKDSVSPLNLSYLYLNMADFYRLQNNQKLQLSYLTRSWQIRIKLKEKHALVWTGVGLASYYTDQGDYEKALSYLDRVQRALEGDTVKSEEIAIINKQRGIVNANLGNHKVALDFFAKAKEYYSRNPYAYDLVNLLSDMGFVQAAVANYEISLKYYFEALKLSEPKGYQRQSAKLYFLISRVYYFLEQNDLAREYCMKNLSYATSHQLELEEASAQNLLGLISVQEHKYQDAVVFFNRALFLRQKNNDMTGVANTLGNFGELFEAANDFKRAEDYALKSLAIHEQMDNVMGKNYSYQAIGQLYLRMKDYEKAEYYLNKGEAFSRKIGSRDILVRHYKNRRDLLLARKIFQEAIRYSLLYEELRDSLLNKNLTNRIVTLRHDFELDQKNSEIKILNQQRQLQQSKLDLQQAEIKRQWYIIGVGLIVFFNLAIGAYIVFRFYKKVKKLNREISEQNEEIITQSEELKEANEALSKLNRDISEQKEEIQAQAEELTESNDTISRVNTSLEEKVKIRTAELKEAYHELDTFFYRSSHDFRRPLTTFMGLAEVAKVTVKDIAALELFEKVNETARNLDKMLLKLQSVSAAGSQELIYSEVLLEQIFQIELDNFREGIIQRSIRVLTDIKLEQPFYSYPVLVKFIIQNLVENSIAFCGVESPFIKFKAYQVVNETVLEISDNGQGIELTYLNRIFDMYFRANEKSRGNGLGLYIVKKMVDKLNGRIELKSEHGLGTTVWVYLPNHFK
jgi:signal transduction histidine kinase